MGEWHEPSEHPENNEMVLMELSNSDVFAEEPNMIVKAVWQPFVCEWIAYPGPFAIWTPGRWKYMEHKP